MTEDDPCRFRPSQKVAEVGGAVIVIDVIRAFTTAAYALEAGARHIYLVDTVADALAFKETRPGTIAMGEDHGLRPEGFDLSNSPVGAASADLDGRVVVHRTSAGTRGVHHDSPPIPRPSDTSVTDRPSAGQRGRRWGARWAWRARARRTSSSMSWS